MLEKVWCESDKIKVSSLEGLLRRSRKARQDVYTSADNTSAQEGHEDWILPSVMQGHSYVGTFWSLAVVGCDGRVVRMMHAPDAS